MRRSLYVVLMVVLVLRGLVGTAMAAGMLPPTAAQHHTAAAAHLSHHGSDPAAQAHQASPCADCDICHSALADAPPAPAPAPTAMASTGRPAAADRFESAWPAPALKPPIA